MNVRGRPIDESSRKPCRARRSKVWWIVLVLGGALLALQLAAASQIAVTVTIRDTGDPACSGGTGICPEPSLVGQQYAVEFEVRVTGSNPSSLTPYGTVTVTDGHGATDSRTVSSGSYPTGWVWRCFLTSTTTGDLTITATFVSSDGNFAGGSDTEQHTVLPATGVNVFLSDTPLVVNETATGVVTVYGVPQNYSTPPTGTVTLSHTGSGTLTPSSYTLTAADGGRFEFTYKPTSAAVSPHVITATYAGDSVYAAGSDTFDQAVVKRALDLEFSLSVAEAFVAQPVTVAIHMEDDTTAGTPGSMDGLEITLDDGGKAGTFSDSSPTLNANGNCAVTYTPGAGDAGTSSAATTITASYPGSGVYQTAGASQPLTVHLRPTQVTVTGSSSTLLVNQGYAYSVSVQDVAGVGSPSSPGGTLSYSSYLGADASLVPSAGLAPSGAFVYTCTGLDGDAGIDTIYAQYTATDGIHAGSEGYFGQGVQRRPTVTTVIGASTATGVSYTATIRENVDNAPAPTVLQGDVHLLEPDGYPCTGLAGVELICAGSFDSGSPLANVTVQFEPTDRTHLGSTGSVNIEREFTPDDGDGTTGANCTDGCGDGGYHITEMLYQLNASKVALEAVKLGLDVTTLVLDVIPDGVITGGLLVQTGVTIPYSDIAKAIVAGSAIALDIAILAMDTDLDGDGLPDVIEENVIGSDPFNWDTDGDGMSDNDEVEEAGGYFGGTRRPNPLVADSDGDGIGDGDESNLSHTDFCVADSDCDTVSDGVEYATWGATQTEVRDQADPLMLDTDGDGLRDDLEIDLGCPYVNDDDSDDDGLQDGYEYFVLGEADVAAASGNDGELFDDGIGSVCDPDSDGDGLLDGEEVQLGTDPLDWDTDDDGLSDYEELQVYFTNPLTSDTDGDGAEGILTERPAGGPGALLGFGGATHSETISKHDCISGITVTQSVTFYTNVTLLSDGVEALSRTGQFPFDALGDQADPLQRDTDGDGIDDATEFVPGCGGCGAGTGGLYDGYVNNADSDYDGLADYPDAHKDVPPASLMDNTPRTRSWVAWPEPKDADGFLGTTDAGLNDGELDDDGITGICDADSDGDGLLDGEEHQLGFDPYDWDTDDDGRNDGEELSGGGPIPSDPADFDTDDDGLGDGVEVYGANPTNPLNADTDGDGLADGGLATPSAVAGIDGSGTSPLVKAGVANHPNPYGYGEDEDGDGAITAGETNPNDYDSDDDALGDGVEKLAYSTSRQSSIPAVDLLSRAITVAYPPAGATITYPDCSCLDPLNPDTDGDGLADGVEDLNHDGNFDFNPSDFDFQDLLDGAPQPDPEETNPCDPDTDHDGLTDIQERFQTNPSSFYPFNPTNPLDFDTDNDYLSDGDEVSWACVDPGFNLDPNLDGVDEYFVMGTIDGVLDPTNRDSDSDGYIDGLDPNPCYSWLLPIGVTEDDATLDSDGDGFSDADELAAGTDPYDSADFPLIFVEDFDRDLELDDAIWLEDYNVDGAIDSVAIDLYLDSLVDARIVLVARRDVTISDLDGDGREDDLRIQVTYAFANGRALQPRVFLTIIDLDRDFVVDRVEFDT